VAVVSAVPYANLHLAQTDNQTSTPPFYFLQAGCPSCRPTNSVKALKSLVFTRGCPYNNTYFHQIHSSLVPDEYGISISSAGCFCRVHLYDQHTDRQRDTETALGQDMHRNSQHITLPAMLVMQATNSNNINELN